MAEDDIYGFGPSDATRIGNAVSFVEHDPRYPKRPRKYAGPQTGLLVVVGVLTSPMTAASPDGLTGPTTFTFKIWRPDPSDSSDPQHFIQDADDTTGVNRSKRTANSGDFCFFFYLNGEWNADPQDCD